MKGVLLVLVSAGVLVGQSQEASVTDAKIPTDGLIAYYPLNGNANDGAGNRHGKIKGEDVTAAADRLGRAGRALRFANESFVEIPVDLNASKFPALTICAWARLEGDAGDGVIYQVVSHDDGDYDRSLGVDHRGGGVGWSAFAGSAEVLGSRMISQQWTFLAATWDKRAGVVTLFVNDKKFTTQGTVGEGMTTARIGGSPGFGEHFPGIIDEVRIYGRILKEEEIKRLIAFREP